jgi:SOS response regulatory protein OraA/RecX
MNYAIPNEWQFHFLLNSITKKKRFSKWQKKEKASESLLLVQEYFGYSSEKAREALTVLTEEQLNEIKLKLNKGGK